jgi:hydroxyacylglutathione hydrolase
MVAIVPIDTPTLGDRSYLAHDGHVALVVDPQRDIDRLLTVADEAGVRITHVFETHLHNDYVTGGLALARATGAAYHVNAADEVAFERVAVVDGDVIEVGPSLRVTVIATPGHTFTHLSYALSAEGEQVGVFSGGSLLFGSTGRPDLLGPDHTRALVHHQYASAHRLAAELPDAAEVLPTHGFGSFCSATQSEATSSTIGQEKVMNPALRMDEQAWVEELLAGLDAWPAYYARMGPANAAGPGAADLSAPESADKEALRARLEAGEWLVDLRSRTAFAAGHVPGTFSFGIDGQFATYLGWLIPWGTPLTLLGESPEQVAEAQRELVRIGIDRPAAAATGSPEQWTDEPLGRFERATFADLAQVRHHRTVTILDVRRMAEWAGSHIEGALHVPLHELLGRLDDVPAGEVWVHCGAGYRASIAASILTAHGHSVVAVDDSYGEHAAAAGLPMATPEHAQAGAVL